MIPTAVRLLQSSVAVATSIAGGGGGIINQLGKGAIFAFYITLVVYTLKGFPENPSKQQ